MIQSCIVIIAFIDRLDHLLTPGNQSFSLWMKPMSKLRMEKFNNAQAIHLMRRYNEAFQTVHLTGDSDSRARAFSEDLYNGDWVSEILLL